MPAVKMPTTVLLALTLGPVIAIGATLWIVSDLVPACTVAEQARVTSPDNRLDLVVFSRDCGDTPANTQATLVPPSEEVPYDAASFLSLVGSADLAPRWDAEDNIEITLPPDAEIFRQDATAAGVTITYLSSALPG